MTIGVVRKGEDKDGQYIFMGADRLVTMGSKRAAEINKIHLLSSKHGREWDVAFIFAGALSMAQELKRKINSLWASFDEYIENEYEFEEFLDSLRQEFSSSNLISVFGKEGEDEEDEMEDNQTPAKINAAFIFAGPPGIFFVEGDWSYLNLTDVGASIGSGEMEANSILRYRKKSKDSKSIVKSALRVASEIEITCGSKYDFVELRLPNEKTPRPKKEEETKEISS